MKELLLQTMFCMTLIVFAISFMIGIIKVDFKGCKYTSLASRMNLGYVIGCELGRPRFEPYK